MSILEKCSAGGIACGISGFLTNPSDVIKIRNQQYGGQKYGSFFKTFQNIVKEKPRECAKRNSGLILHYHHHAPLPDDLEWPLELKSAISVNIFNNS